MDDLWTVIAYGLVAAAGLLAFYNLIKAAVRNGVKEALREFRSENEEDFL